ncbi:MAG: hypothetical protein OXS30_07070 [Chloroflexota bacterium]|nr:hypothetical protein [Chloroflexota bacterium]
MGSRIGSIAILLMIAAIVVAVIVVINRLDLLDTGEPDAPVMVVSLDEGELLLLNEPRSITVTISSGNPIATLELFVDDAKIADVVPPYSQDRGAWIGSFVWTPEQLGFANVQIVALDAEGVESVRQIRVEVTDDEARVAAALRITILGISPLQQFPTGTTILLAISATGSQPIERFEMLVNDNFVIAITPKRDESTGRYVANIEWKPGERGEVNVTINAVDAAGRTESQTIPVVLIPQDGTAPAADSDDQESQTSTEEGTSSDDSSDGEIGTARIESPSDGERFTYDSDFELDVSLGAQNVGAVASALLYMTPISPDNTLGNSVLIHSSEDHSAGDYRERVTDVERFVTSSGSYELQLVVFTPEDERYDHRIVIHVVAVAGQDSDEGQEDEQDGEPSTSDDIDLAIVTARQADDDRTRLNVSITNASTVDIERTDVLITVVDATTGAELASAAVTLGIASEDLFTIPLELELDPGERVEALVLLEAGVDTNTSNNTFQISLAPPEISAQQETELATEADEQQDQQQSTTQPEQTGPSPDLSFLDAQSTNDGYVLLTVINTGDGPAETFSIIISDESGAQLELIGRRAADSQPLGPGETEILTSLQPHAGIISIAIVAGGDVAERNLSNNAITLEIGG